MHHARVMLAIVAALLAAGSTANAFGALAIDSNRGPAYGFSYDQDSAEAARAAAIEKCGPDCSVIITFEFACAAYAADQSTDDGAYGWGYAATRGRAQYFAMKFCNEFGGDDCQIRVWACESVRDVRGMARFEGKPKAQP